MAAAAVIPNMPTSFVYEDLIAKVQMIQNQMNNIQIVLTNRWKIEKRKRDELKSRSLVFNDPYGSRTVIKYMDHEFIHNVINKYKKDYIPKYLQQWIKVGIMKDSIILPLNDYELKSNVSQYKDGYEFITYGEVVVWVGTYNNAPSYRVVLRILLTDIVEKIKTRLKKFQRFTNIELKSFITNPNAEPNEKNWNEGTILKLEETIMSCQSFQNNCIIMAKVNEEKVKNHSLLLEDNAINFNNDFCITVNRLAGSPLNIYVYSDMGICTLKERIREKVGIPPDQQRLLFDAKQLEDDGTVADYNIKQDTVIYLILCLRGGMYHFTSGRHDFTDLPYLGIKAIQNILTLNAIDIDQIHHLSSTELQEFVLQAHTILSKLLHEIKEYRISYNLPNLKNIVLSTPASNEDSSDEEDDSIDTSNEK